MKREEAERRIGTTVAARVDGTLYRARLEATTGARAWKGVVRILAVESLGPRPQWLLREGACVVVYGGDLAHRVDTGIGYDDSVELAFWAVARWLDSVPLPPMLELALDLDDVDGNLLALWWAADAHTVRCYNGVIEVEGSMLGWLAFVQHSRVAPFLEGASLGAPGCPASECLVVDRGNRTVAVAGLAQTTTFLRHLQGPCAVAAGPLDRAFVLEVLRSCPELMASDVPGADIVLGQYQDRASELWA